VRSTSRSGWGRAGHRRAVLIGALAFAIVIGGGVAAWSAVSGSAAGYRMVTVTRADIADTLTVVGSVAPVNEAAPSFQVGGKVTSISVTPGSPVAAGETLGTLDTTALSETVSSDESALNADEAKLAEDEANQSGTGSSSNSANGSSGAQGSTTTTTSPGLSGTGASGTGGSGSGSGAGTGGQGGTKSPTVTKDQTTLTQDEAALSKAQQQEAADLAQAQTECTAANTGTPAGQATCESALQTVSGDERAVSTDQSTVSKDETALAQALAAESSAGTTSGNSGSTPHAAEAQGASAGNTGNTGSGSSTGTGSDGKGSTTPASSGSGGSSGNTNTPEQIASDQAAIDSAQADLTEAQQSLKEATLTSPISGTVVSVAISAGDTVSAGSSTEIITILGTNSYEVEATLDSAQIPSVKVGQAASVEVDGVDGNIEGTVSQVGPVQSGSSGYSYPVIVALPVSSSSDMHAGSTGDVTITTGAVSDVVAVPTSAVQSFGSTSYVMELSKGELTRKVIKVGMVGDTYTQVDSGLSPGQTVVLVDYAEDVPSSNTNTDLGNVLGGGGGGGGFFPGGGRGFFPGGGNGTFQIKTIGG
jgi:multidrug efflux pump subunit AcrA (membrane-fusion protein)